MMKDKVRYRYAKLSIYEDAESTVTSTKSCESHWYFYYFDLTEHLLLIKRYLESARGFGVN